MIGLIGTPRFEPGRGVEVGYQLDPDYFGKGYMTEALDTFLTLYWSVESKFDIYFFDGNFGESH